MADPVIALTSGEPAGIGAELCLHMAQHRWPARLVVLGDMGLLAERARATGMGVNLQAWSPAAMPCPGTLEVIHLPLAVPARAGTPDTANARYVLDLLDCAVDGCVAGRFSAMVTAPVQKSAVADAGIPFTGHTEYLAARTGTAQVVMLLAGRTANGGSDGWLRVALATTHLALAEVPRAITRDRLATTLRILHADLRGKFGIASPRILVAGLNPHAGEGGHLGREEIDVIHPVCDALRAEGMRINGPLPADTLFVPHTLHAADAVLAMYHDQGLPVLKHATFGQGINVTLGLPIIRTSVDHGTALDLAGTGRADPGSMRAAVEAAIDMARRRAASASSA